MNLMKLDEAVYAYRRVLAVAVEAEGQNGSTDALAEAMDAVVEAADDEVKRRDGEVPA